VICNLNYVRDFLDYAVDDIFCRGHTAPVAWTVEVTDEFETWWDQLTEDERISLDGMIRVLEAHGPSLGSPYNMNVPGSRHPQLRQLRVPHQGQSLCVLYFPDEEHAALVLLTGTTTGTQDEPCPPEHVELADRVYRNYLTQHEDPP
jgi:hypothetical protein